MSRPPLPPLRRREPRPVLSKRAALVLFLALVSMLVVVLACGCSPSVSQWAERGHQGIANARANDAKLYTLAVKELMDKREQAIADQIGGILDDAMLRAKNLKAASQPTSQPTKTDAQWRKEAVAILLASVGEYDRRKAELDDQYDVMLRNLQSTDESFYQIQRLNRAWANSSDALASQISQLTALVQQLAIEKGGK